MTAENAWAPAQPLPAVVIELARLLERRIHGEVSGQEVTANQFMAMLRIAGRPGLSRAELARGMQISPQAVGVLTTQLFDKGLVVRTVNRRGLPIELSLTDAGNRVVQFGGPRVEGVTHDMLRYFRPNLANALDGALRYLLVKLD